MFILFFLGCGFSFVFWCFSLPICCLKRRGWGYSMSTLVFITFCVMLTAFIISLVVIFLGIKAVTSTGGWSAEVGNTLWITIAAFVSLLFSFLCYTGGTTCGGITCGGGRKKKNKNAIDPNYKDKHNDGNAPNSTQPLYMASPIFVPQTTHQTAPQTGPQTGPQTDHQGNMLQQPYSPNIGNQQHQNFDTTGHTGQTHDPNSVSVPMHGYQTPTLQPANPPH